MPAVLGLSAYFHDSAACLVRERGIAAAVQEERSSRLKHDARFPARAAGECLRVAGLSIDEVDLVVHYELPRLHAERVLHSQMRFSPRAWRAFPKAVRGLFDGKLWVEHAVGEELFYDGPVLFVPHHLSHAASAYLPSPFDEAAVLTVDGVGEWATTLLAHGKGGSIESLEEQRFPHSLGLFYGTMTAWAGFRVNSGEYKLMGLAPYGRPRFAEALRQDVIRVGADGSVKLNLEHFDFPAGVGMGKPSLARFLGGPPRGAGEPLTEREADLAASAQAITDEALIAMARHARARTGARHLCLAGGVALNCVAVSRLGEAAGFDRVFVQPAAGDAGGALGAALLGTQHLAPGFRPERAPDGDAMQGALLGPEPTEAELESALRGNGLVFTRHEPADLDARVADLLARGEIGGWFQGRMEFGPRALGSRSILADPRGADVRDRVNRHVKQREGFRPFAPSVLAESAAEWFEIDRPEPYMTGLVRVRGFEGVERTPAEGRPLEPWPVRSPLPAVTHVDGTARVQTVDRRVHPRFHALLSAFRDRTGVPVLLNTSFNLRGEPLVASPEDACRTFAHAGLDLLALGPFLVRRSEQRPGVLERIDAPTRISD